MFLTRCPMALTAGLTEPRLYRLGAGEVRSGNRAVKGELDAGACEVFMAEAGEHYEAIDVSDVGERVLVAEKRELRVCEADGKVIGRLPHSGPVLQALSTDGKQLVVADYPDFVYDSNGRRLQLSAIPTKPELRVYDTDGMKLRWHRSISRPDLIGLVAGRAIVISVRCCFVCHPKVRFTSFSWPIGHPSPRTG